MAPFYPPTPPYSPLPQDESQMPEHQRTEDTLHSTKLALDSLIASYQHRQMWVCRARAALENDSPEFESYGPGTHALPPPGSSSYLDDDAYDQAEDRSSSSASPNSRWTKRKRGFKLRLDGLQAGKQRRVIAPHLDGTSADLQPMPVPSRDDILSMYEKMMESRMESCQRINKLIHDANRAHLHDR